MGQQQSSALQTCLNAVCQGRNNCVAYPSDPLYQISWVHRFNLDIAAVPAAVVRPTTAAEVAAAVQCAAASNLSVQAASGGHSYANLGFGGASAAGSTVALDMVNLAHFKMDTTTWQATIGPGARLGAVTQQLVDNGNRAFAHGVCPSVGLGGHATVGGLGPMSRMWGTALDHIVEVEVVTANGTIVRASDTKNADLFFALRGAGASFGIVTEFVMRTHPAPGSVVQYSYSVALGRTADMMALLGRWLDLARDPALDRRFSTEFVLQPLGAVIQGTFYGTEAEWQASGLPERLPQTGEGNRTLTLQGWLGALAAQAQNEALYLSALSTPLYSKSLAFAQDMVLSNDSARAVLDYINDADKGTLVWFIIFDTSGGAIADVAANATAYTHRDTVLFYQSYAVGVPSLTNTTRAFLQGVHSTILAQVAPVAAADGIATIGTYPGYIDLALATPQQSYWGGNLAALQAVKTRWDPQDVFHNAQSVSVPSA